MTDRSGTRPAPSATGTLAATPLVNVLVYARSKRLTGTLALRSVEAREATITFWRGRIRRVLVNPPILPLGTVLQMLQLVDRATLEAALQSAAGKRLIGEELVARGALTAAQRDKALLEQSSRRVFDLFALPPATVFGFYDEVAEVETPPHLLEPLVPAWLGLKDAPPKDLDGVVARFEGATLRLVNENALYPVGFDDEERRLVEALSRRPVAIRELRTMTRAPRTADLVVYLLLVGKCVEPVAQTQTPHPGTTPSGGPPGAAATLPPMRRMSDSKIDILASLPPKRRISEPMMPATRPSKPDHQVVLPTFKIPSKPGMRAPSVPNLTRSGSMEPPPSSKPQPVATKTLPSPAELGPDAIIARAGKIEELSFFDALGVPDGAPAEAVRSAYIRLAKQWHPDRLPRELANVRQEVATIFAVISRAHDTLTNDASRASYIAERREGAARQARRAASLKQADDALGRRDFFVVEREAKAILHDFAADADALALLAWGATLAGSAPDPVLRSSLAILHRAVETTPTCERALLYRGLLHKRLGELDAALRDFKQVLERNPAHPQAGKEAAALGTRMNTATSLKAQAAPPAKTKL